MSSFNYMVLLGEFKSDTNEYHPTGYYQLYQSMINVPYLGSSIPILLPSLILLFSLLFAALSALRIKNRVLHAFRGAVADGSQPDASEPAANASAGSKSPLIDSIMRGERAILLEVQLERTKAERNRLLRYNVPQVAVPSGLPADAGKG